MFKQATGTFIVHIPYRGSAPAFTDLMAGQVQMMAESIPQASQYVKAGKLRALAVSSRKRLDILPEVPTFDEAGLKGYESSNWFGLMAPVRVPKEVIARVNADTNKVLASAGVKSRFEGDGLVPRGGTTADFDQFIRAEIVKYEQVIRKAGIRPL